MKPKKINLNDFDVCAEEDADIVIIPKGEGLTPLYFQRTNGRYEYVEDTDNCIWFKNARISTSGTDEEYAARVDWYFDNLNEEFLEELTKTVQPAIDLNWDLELSLNKLRAKLKLLTGTARKSYIAKAIVQWIIGGANWWVTHKGK